MKLFISKTVINSRRIAIPLNKIKAVEETMMGGHCVIHSDGGSFECECNFDRAIECLGSEKNY